MFLECIEMVRNCYSSTLHQQIIDILQNPLIKPCKHKPQVTLACVPMVHTLYLYDTIQHFTSITWCELSMFADEIQLHVHQNHSFSFTHKISLYKISFSKNHLSISSYQEKGICGELLLFRSKLNVQFVFFLSSLCLHVIGVRFRTDCQCET